MSKFKIMLCCTFHSSNIHIIGKGQIYHTCNMVHGKTAPKD